MANTQKQLQDALAKVQALEQQIAALSVQLTDLKALLVAEQSTIDALTAERDALVVERDSLKAQVVTLTAERDAAIADKNAATDLADRAVRERDEARQALADCQAGNGGGTTPAQTIDQFASDATTIDAGASATLNWQTSNASAVRLDGAGVATSGSKTVTPAQDSTYTLDADGASPTVSRLIAVAVRQPAPPPPSGFQPNPLLAAMAANTALDLGAFNLEPALGDDSGSTYHWTDEGIWHYDEKRNRILGGPGGGHSSTNYDALVAMPMETIKFAPLYQATPRDVWVESNYDKATNGAWLSGGPNGSGPYPRPASRHTLCETGIDFGRVEGNYPNVGTYDPATRKYYWNGQESGGYNLSSTARAAQYPLGVANAQWAFAGITGQYEVGTGNPPYGTARFDPVSGKFVLLSYWALSTYDPTTMTRVEHYKFMERAADLAAVVDADTGQPVGTNAFSVFNYVQTNLIYCAANDRMYYMNRYSGSVPVMVLEITPSRGDPAGDWAHATIKRINPTNAPTISETDEIGWAYDSDNALIGGGPFANKFHALDPIGRKWYTQTIQGSALPGTLGARTHCIAYAKVDRRYVFAVGTHAWAYRWN